MPQSLGIYINNNIIKYAKLDIEDLKKDPKITIQKYGTKFIVNDNKLDLIKSVISETDSSELPVIVGTYDDYFSKVQVFKQLSKNDSHNVINLEFEDWCVRNSKESQDYLYTFLVPNVAIGDNYITILNVSKKEQVELYRTQKDVAVKGMYTVPFILTSLVPKDEKNYLLVNLDERLYVTTVIDKKIIEFDFEEIGMKDIFERFTQLLGSYQKSYEACKTLNVFSEGESNNPKDLEAIVEPVLQDILKKVLEIANRRKSSISKVFLTGSGTLFTNIDILFREFLDIKSEILKPDFINFSDNVKNVAEELETVPAMALSYEYYLPAFENSSYFKKNVSGFSEMFGKVFNFQNNKNEKNPKPKDSKAQNVDQSKNSVFQNISSGFDLEKFSHIIVSVCIVLVLLLFTYLIFGNIYVSQINKMKADIDTKTASIADVSSKISNDAKYIDNNTNQYKSINDDVQKTVDEIETNQIGKNSTYNVATFMQKIIKVIPKNVQLKTIKSDDNKNITITAQSDTYADLGYFVAQLKLQNVLNNVKINNITNGTTINIEIGGELP